jgi:hypothetical protein
MRRISAVALAACTIARYKSAAPAIAKQRLAWAGARLANLLNAALK